MKRTKNRKIAGRFLLLAVLFLTFLLVPQNVHAAKYKLNKTNISLNAGKTYQLQTNKPKKKTIWSTSNKKVAKVGSNGKVTAIKKGTAYIYAKIGGKKLTCKVTVKQPVTKVKLNKTSATIAKGKSLTLTATIKPNNASNKSVKWSSSDKKVATVNNKGKVTAKKEGTAIITATTKDGSKKKATCKITVVKDKKYKIDLGKGKTDVVVGHFETDCAKQLIKMINDYRVTNGCEKLEENPELMNAASIRSYEISKYFSSIRPNGEMYDSLTPIAWTESYLRAPSLMLSPESIMNIWLKNSADSMLDQEYTQIGVMVFAKQETYSDGSISYTYYAIRLMGLLDEE